MAELTAVVQRRDVLEQDLARRREQYDQYVRVTGEWLAHFEAAVAQGRKAVPRLVRDIRDGGRPQPAGALPEGPRSDSPFARFARELEQFRHQALDAIAEVASVRREHPDAEPREMLLYIAARQGALISRALAAIDALEHKTEDPDLSNGLFGIDQLIMMLRRHIENFALLAGTSSRNITAEVLLSTVMRHAASEIEHFSRVRTAALPLVNVRGYVVADLIHLFAELMENATKFSSGSVLVRAELTSAGLVVEVEDRGLHMPGAMLEEINHLLKFPGRVDRQKMVAEGRMGLLVVAVTADRHKLSVELRKSFFGGTSAYVVVPQSLLAPLEPEPSTDEDLAPLTRAEVEAVTPRRTAPALAAVREPSTAGNRALPRRTSRRPDELPAAETGRPALPVRVPVGDEEIPQAPEASSDPPPPATANLFASYSAGTAAHDAPDASGQAGPAPSH
ncbi:ATP-binding protein [Streptomyces sp. SID1121]|uniref:ATP-binding protein n=1 Tax=Streptomyces sp. SID1121 TaxID=3425888 RepID=UPI004056B451